MIGSGGSMKEFSCHLCTASHFYLVQTSLMLVNTFDFKRCKLTMNWCLSPTFVGHVRLSGPTLFFMSDYFGQSDTSPNFSCNHIVSHRNSTSHHIETVSRHMLSYQSTLHNPLKLHKPPVLLLSFPPLHFISSHSCHASQRS